MAKTPFQQTLRDWYLRNKRDLPWRETKDPYKIWLSEIILQQTRVDQGMPYYQRFVENYPTVHELANAPADSVMKDWEGLGYYSRARNLHETARYVSSELGGEFPADYQGLLKLKGIGDYTAAAISSISYNEARAVLDGNVFRLLSRYFAIDTPINTGPGKKEFAKMAAEVLDNEDPALHNQAMMEFGARQCVPVSPDCSVCPLQSGCHAYKLSRVSSLPKKEKKVYNRHRYFDFLLVNHKGKVLVEKREAKDIWRGLFQFPLLEFSDSQKIEELSTTAEWNSMFPQSTQLEATWVLPPHKLSHQTLFCRLHRVQISDDDNVQLAEHMSWIPEDELPNLAMPRPLRTFLDAKQLTLPLLK